MLDIPGAFIGEFDALDGPKVTYAFEYFDYHRQAANNSLVRQLLCFVEGVALLGRHVASGMLHRECKEYLNSVAAHVLTSNESREERLLYQESGCPCVGSFLFSVPDIVARGEKRRFCLIFLHPSYHELVARWDYMSSFVDVLLQRWTQRATARYQAEYSTLTNLEQLREESRRKPLRRLTELLASPEGGAESPFTSIAAQDAMLEDMHCHFDIIFPQTLSQPVPLGFHDKGAALCSAARLLEERLPLAQSTVELVDADAAHVRDADVVLPHFAKQLVFVNSEIVVKPLPLWLLQLFCDAAPEAAPEASVHTLLRALFSGNQILITGDDARDCASLAMSLAYALPPALVKMHLGSETYRMPYESRILTFSQHALAEHAFASSPAAAAQHASSHVVRLYDMEADSIVHVRVESERICAVEDCEALRRAAENQPANEEPAPAPTTLENRILTLLLPHTARAPERSSIPVSTLQLITTQLHQLVSEYVVRGRVYGQLFSKQEVDANNRSLAPTASSPIATSARSPLRASATSPTRPRHFSLAGFGWRGSLSGGTSQPAQSRANAFASNIGGASGAEESECASPITKHAHLSAAYGKQFKRQHYVFSSFAPEDHAILIFLGSA